MGYFENVSPERTQELANYHIYWKHQYNKTICFIKNKGEVIATGESHVSPNEKFYVKEVGRKLSLRRAIEKLNLSKDERQVIWVNYFARIFR